MHEFVLSQGGGAMGGLRAAHRAALHSRVPTASLPPCPSCRAQAKCLRALQYFPAPELPAERTLLNGMLQVEGGVPLGVGGKGGDIPGGGGGPMLNVGEAHLLVPLCISHSS